MASRQSPGLPTNRAADASTALRLLQPVLLVALQALLLFLPAGHLGWAGAWAYLLLYTTMIVVNAWGVLARRPTLAFERSHPGERVKPWDRWLARALGNGSMLPLLVAGFDRRCGWSAAFPLAIQLAAATCVGLGYALTTWALACNPFYSSVVRIQRDRGHTVVRAGPYAYLRHPGYLGLLAFTLATPLLLGSLWALLPAAGVVGVVIVRTALEDRTLQEELPGYDEYSRLVRFRLLPGMW